MTDFLSRLREAIVCGSRCRGGLHSEHDEDLVLDAARRFSEGEPLLWCETHWSGSVEGKFCQLVASTPFPEEQSCRIVSQWRCPPPEGPT